MLEHLGFAEPCGSVVQMCEYAILTSEYLSVFAESFNMVRVSILRVWPHKISQLGDTLLAVENRGVKNAWLHFAREFVIVAVDNIVLHRAPVHKSLAVHARDARVRSYTSFAIRNLSLHVRSRGRRCWRMNRSPTGVLEHTSVTLERIVCSLCELSLLFIEVLNLVVWHPLN